MKPLPIARSTFAAVGLLAVAACGESREKQDQAAYEACLKSAQADAKIGKATFAKFADSKLTGSTGEEDVRVNIPYEFEGKKALFQCIARKQNDGTFKVVF